MMPRSKKVKIHWIMLGILLILSLCACGVITVIALIATNDTRGLEEKKAEIEVKYDRFEKIASDLGELDIEDLRSCKASDMEEEKVLDMNYIDLEYMKTLGTKGEDESWGFLNGNEFSDLSILDEISYNARANNISRSIENIESDKKILVIDAIMKSLPERIEDTDVFQNGYFVGYVVLVDLSENDKAICKVSLNFESSESVPSEDDLLDDFEEQFKASLVIAFE